MKVIVLFLPQCRYYFCNDNLKAYLTWMVDLASAHDQCNAWLFALFSVKKFNQTFSPHFGISFSVENNKEEYSEEADSLSLPRQALKARSFEIIPKNQFLADQTITAYLYNLRFLKNRPHFSSSGLTSATSWSPARAPSRPRCWRRSTGWWLPPAKAKRSQRPPSAWPTPSRWPGPVAASLPSSAD